MTIPEEIEHLKARLGQTALDREQGELLIQLLRKLISVHPAEARSYIDRLDEMGHRMNEPMYLAWSYYYLSWLKRMHAEYDESIKLSVQALDIFEKNGDKIGLVSCYNNIGLVQCCQSNYSEALKNHLSALKISEEIGDNPRIANLLNNIGLIYRDRGNYPVALKYLFEGLKIYEMAGDRSGLASSRNNIGTVYWDQGNYPEALKNFEQFLNIKEELKEKEGIALALNNIGTVHQVQGQYIQALEYHIASLEIKKEISDISGIANSYIGIGNVYQTLMNYEESLKSYFSALKIMEEIGDKKGIAYSNYCIGMDYFKSGDYTAALKNLRDSIMISEEIGHKDTNKQASAALSDTYSALGDYENALACYRRYHELEKELLGEESQKQINNLQFMHNLEQKEKDAAFEKQKREEAEGLRKIVEQKNTELIQSINYALKIQSAILPSSEKIKHLFPASFVLYQPKDIVSGDFYWMEAVTMGGGRIAEDEANEQGLTHSSLVSRPLPPSPVIFFAACDCTGHGVPGAMVSLVCHNALNRAVHEFNLTKPSLILDKVCALVVESFKASDEDVKDGMDISLCAYDPESNMLQWSGANNPLWLLRGDEIIEIKADKQPIGATDYGKPFTNHTLEMAKGDRIYLFSDGYADQFGGPDGKKLTRKKLKQLLLDTRTISLPGQGEQLDQFIADYKKDTFQIDDILVMGMEIN